MYTNEYLCVPVYHRYAVPMKAREDFKSPRTGVTNSCVSSGGGEWGQESGSALTTEQSLQPVFVVFLRRGLTL